jgi:gliding motility-associated-like protein
MTSPQFTADYEGTAPVDVHFENTSLNFANLYDPFADTTFFWNFNYDNTDWIISNSYFETFDTTYGLGDEYQVCLVAINKNGCTDTTCKTLIIYDPLVFVTINIFSPDGDGINDIFSWNFKSDAVSEFSCSIVNRWGVVVHEMDNITDGWDGNNQNGAPCQDGVYFYTYTGKADNKTPFEGQGTIQLVRKK